MPLEVTDPLFEAEQQLFSPITEPILLEAFTRARIPWAESLARLGSEVIVPSSLIPFTKGVRGLKLLAKLRAAVPRAIQEGVINVQQNRAAKDIRGEPPPDIIEDLQMFGFGLIAGGLGPEVFNLIRRGIDKIRVDPPLVPVEGVRGVAPAAEIAPTARGAPLETAGVRRAPKTGDEVALVSDPSTPVGRIIAQSEQGVTIRPDTGPAFLRSRGRVQVFEDAPSVRPEAPVEPAVVEPARVAPVEPGVQQLSGRPLSEQTASPRLFHETSADNARRFLDDATIPDEAFSGRAGVFVTDTPELALGQRGRGATVILDSSRVSGRQRRPPGQSPEMARELGTNFETEDAVAGSVLEVRFSSEALKADRVTNRWLQNVEQFSQGKPLRGRGPVLTVERQADGSALVRVGAEVVEPGVAPIRAAAREVPAAGTKEFTERSSIARARLQAILDDPSQPKAVRRDAQKLFDRVCK
jgi:hypothetical protein